jgi:glutathione S-transferase
MITLYDLDGRDGHRFSPFCWRTKMALKHKGILFEEVAVGFTQKDRIAFSGQTLVPIIVDHDNGQRRVNDSWAIAEYLETQYPANPLFGDAGGRALARFVQSWVDTSVHMGIFRIVLHDLHEHAQPADRPYFRQSRESRLGGATLEAFQADAREAKTLAAFRSSLEPMRRHMKGQPFIAGAAPSYADHILFGAFQWARCSSPFPVILKDDPVYAWRERMLDLFDGFARKAKGYDY